MNGLRQILGIYARGFCMGAADAVPGVSGGTIAFLTGIYQRLIDAITAITVSRLIRLFRDARMGNRTAVTSTLQRMDIWFLLVLGTGVFTAVITVLRLISWLLTVSPVEVYGFFFGLIGASAIVLYRDVSVTTWGERTAVVGGFLIAFITSGVVFCWNDRYQCDGSPRNVGLPPAPCSRPIRVHVERTERIY